jgi:hypothetical protein
MKTKTINQPTVHQNLPRQKAAGLVFLAKTPENSKGVRAMFRKISIIGIGMFFIVSMITMVLAPPVNAAYESSLKAYWKFDETSGAILDSSGNGTDSTSYFGFGTNDSNRNQAGKIGKSYYFDGYSGINFGNHANLQPNTPFTISTWVQYPNGQPDSSYRRIYSKEYQVYFGSQGNLISGATTGSWGYNGVYTSPPSRNTWHHLTMTYASNVLTLYLDGNQVSINYNTSMYTGYNYGVSVGYGADTSGQRYVGYLDDMGYWNTAKSAADVYSIYVNGIHPTDVASRKAELSSYLTGTGLTLSDATLSAMASAAINDAPGTVTSIASGMSHFEPLLMGSSGSYYYDFSTFVNLAANSWAWGTGAFSAYSSLDDWYAKVITGTFITADGDAILTGNETWFLKTGGGTGSDGTGGGGAVPEPATVVSIISGIFMLASRRFSRARRK